MGAHSGGSLPTDPPTFEQSLVLLLSAGQGLNIVYIQCVCYAIKVSLMLR